MWGSLDSFFLFPSILAVKTSLSNFILLFFWGRTGMSVSKATKYLIILTGISATCCSLPESFHHFPKDETLNARPENSVIKRTETFRDISCPPVSSKVSDGAWRTMVCVCASLPRTTTLCWPREIFMVNVEHFHFGWVSSSVASCRFWSCIVIVALKQQFNILPSSSITSSCRCVLSQTLAEISRFGLRAQAQPPLSSSLTHLGRDLWTSQTIADSCGSLN